MSKRIFAWISQPFVLLPLILVACFAAGTISVLALLSYQGVQRSKAEFNTFASCSELVEYLNQDYNNYYYAVPGRAVDDVTGGEGSGTTGGGVAPSYSETNVQVAGVDEADVVKTDGGYIYSISGSQVFVLSATAGVVKQVATVPVADIPQQLLLNGDKLVVIAHQNYSYGGPVYDLKVSMPLYADTNQVSVQIFDISTPAQPKLQRSILFDGYYTAARMIGDYVYIVANYNSYGYGSVTESSLENVLPRIADVQGRKVQDGDLALMSNCHEISHYGNTGRTFTNVVSINLDADTAAGSKVLVGNTQSIFASAANLYITTPVYPESTVYQTCTPWQQMLFGCASPSVVRDYNNVSTEIFKLKLDGAAVSFQTAGEVSGTLLNQFSMDEHSGYFRVATTSNDVRGTQLNNLYVLDENLATVGKLEGLARTERIYAVRFIGDRAYMVTYKNVDPLFVISLADPKNPTVLGELKIPGFSNYLHPYDERYIIGFGKDTEDQGSFATLKGLKVGLFDVSDPANPQEVSTYTAGGRYSTSSLLDDHKALLFDRERNLLVMPAMLYTDNLKLEQKNEFTGFIVLEVDPETGLQERGRVAYTTEDSYSYLAGIPRSLYIGDYLYTLLNQTVKGSKLSDLILVSELDLK